jgi:hypothetical protein
MKSDLNGAKRPLYKAAIEMLGVSANSQYVTDKWLEENVLTGDESKRKDCNLFPNLFHASFNDVRPSEQDKK